MLYSDEVLRQVREANDIVSLVSEYVPLSKKGSNYFGLCPFHGEKTASFSVNEREQFYHCFGCHAGGNVYTFLMQMENLSFSEAVSRLAERAHITLPEAEMSEKEKQELMKRERMREAATEAAKFYHNQLAKTPEAAEAREYMRSRGITDAFAIRFGLGYSPVSRGGLFQHLKGKGFSVEEMMGAGLLSGNQNSPFDRFFNRLMFPIFDAGGRVIGFGGRVMGEGEPKYLNSPESEIFNKRRNLYMLNLAKKTRRGYLLVVEGYMDVLSLHQAGFDNAVASLGTALTKEQCLLMKRYFNEVVLCYDSDGAGTAAARRAIPLLEEAGLKCRVIRVPGAKDPDQYIRENGPEAFEKVIADALDPVDFELLVLTMEQGETVESKIKVVQGMVERLAQIPSDLERELHIRDMAVKMKVSEAALIKEVNEKRSSTGILEVRPSFRKKEDGEAETKAERQLLAALIQRPELFPLLAGKMGEHFSPELFEARTAPTKEHPEGRLNIYRLAADYVFEQNRQGRAPHPADIVTQLPEAEEQEKLSALLAAEVPEDKRELETYVNQTLKTLLTRKLTESMRSQDSLEAIQKSIKLKKDIQNLWITII